eukprot:2952367-Rhodomonas_salina.1
MGALGADRCIVCFPDHSAEQQTDQHNEYNHSENAFKGFTDAFSRQRKFALEMSFPGTWVTGMQLSHATVQYLVCLCQCLLKV